MGKVKEIIDIISRAGSEYFQTTGGEPLIRKDLLEIFEYAKIRGLKTALASNGLLINEYNAPEIVKIFDSIQISLDGPEEIHNKIRGNKLASQKAVQAIKLLQKNNISQVSVSSVITPHNYPYLEQLAEIVKDLNVALWKIIAVMPIGKSDNQQLWLSKEQFNNLMEFCKKNKNKYKILLAESMGHLGKYEKTSRTLPFFCPVGFLAMCIGVDGGVRGCPEQPDTDFFREGNVLTEDVLSIWKNGFKKYREHLLAQNNDCQNCRYRKDCQGGCWVMKTKDINCAVKRYCL
jgi:radical SAM protein with 4Fe4S-binding SPASM domain